MLNSTLNFDNRDICLTPWCCIFSNSITTTDNEGRIKENTFFHETLMSTKSRLILTREKQNEQRLSQKSKLELFNVCH